MTHHSSNSSTIGNSELIAALNRRLVLEAVRTMQPTYRAEVSRRTQLKPATVTGIVNGLLSRGILLESPLPRAPSSGGGRPPLMLRVNPDFGHILAIDIEPDCVRVARTNLLVEELDAREALIDRHADAETICRRVIELAQPMLAGEAGEAVRGVGVSLPGVIDAEAGMAVSSTNMPRWKDVPVRARLEKELGLPVRLGRSIHLAALHEHWLHPEHADRTTITLSLRTGIGMAVMRKGVIDTGRGELDGEIGHTIIDVDGRECECGSRGCLETFVSSTAINRRVRQLIDEGRGAAVQRALEAGEALRPQVVYRLAKEGDPDCAEIVRDVGRYIGIATANMINLLAPDEMVICGSIDMADDLILDAVRKQIERSALPRHRQHVRLRLSAARERSSLLGAAVLVAQDQFELPRLRHAHVDEATGHGN